MIGIQLVSDYTDYYDNELVCDTNSETLEYIRKESDCMPRGVALNWLRKQGIYTIDIASASQLTSDRLVVYTNPKLHHGLGKIICTNQNASNMYSNYLASEYIEDTGGMTLKHLYIGSRRFRVMLKYKEESLSEFNVESIVELPSELNYLIRRPIFSIDYIPKSNEIIAVDFNEVQSLSAIGFENIMTPSEVRDEVLKALVAYKIK